MILHGLGDPWGGIMILKNSPQSGIMIVKTGGTMILKNLVQSGIMFLKNHTGRRSSPSRLNPSSRCRRPGPFLKTGGQPTPLPHAKTLGHVSGTPEMSRDV